MDKELEEILQKLNTILEKEINEFEKCGGIKSKISEAYEEPYEISIKKNGKSSDGAECTIVGSTLTILVTLAGLEKAVLEKLDPPTELWEMIKIITGVKEAENNE